MKVSDSLEIDFITNHPISAAKAIESCDETTIVTILEKINDKLFIQIVKNLSIVTLARNLQELSIKRQVLLVERIPTQDKIRLFKFLPKDVRMKVLNNLPATLSKPIAASLKITPAVAYEFLYTMIFSVTSNLTVKEVINQIKSTKSSVNKYIYVKDVTGKLLGVTTLKKILISKQNEIIANLVNENVTWIKHDASIKEIEDLTNWQNYHILPVVDDDFTFLGVIRLEDIYKVKIQLSIKRETTVSSIVSVMEVFSVSMFSILDAMFSVKSKSSE